MSLYIRLHTNFWNHRKTMRLKTLIGNDAFWVPQRLWSYAADNQPDGDFSSYQPEELAMLIGYNGDAKALLQALQQAVFMDGMQLHDWEEHNGYHHTYAERAKKAAKARWAKKEEESTKEEEIDMKGKEKKGDKHCIKHATSNASSIIEPKKDMSDKRKLTDSWCYEWEIFHGNKYAFRGAQDGMAAANLLKIEPSIEKIMDIARKAWALDGKHEFERKHSIQLSSFSSQFNSIRLAVGELVNKQKKESINDSWDRKIKEREERKKDETEDNY